MKYNILSNFGFYFIIMVMVLTDFKALEIIRKEEKIMPKTKTLGQYTDKNVDFARAIRACKERTGTELDKLIKLADISRNTYFVHLREPERMTVGELRVYIHTLKIPKEDIIAALYLD